MVALARISHQVTAADADLIKRKPDYLHALARNLVRNAGLYLPGLTTVPTKAANEADTHEHH